MSLDLDKIVERFQNDGYVLLEDFIPLSLIDELKKELKSLVDNFDPTKEASIFDAVEQKISTNYFLSSSDKISFFLEENAWDSHRKSLLVPKESSLNKIGHALHWFDEVFRSFTFSDRIKSLAKAIGLVDPLVVQSMIIFKNAGIGSEVPAHQDATFLYSNPVPKVIGFWIPLEDATETNGCLQFVPGSHRTTPIGRRWIRKTDPKDGSTVLVFVDWPSDSEKCTNIQTTEPSKSESTFKSVPAKKGSLILIDGLVVHRSDPNRSTKPRPAYTFHVFDQGYRNDDDDDETTTEPIEWDQFNWLQPTDQYSFPRLFESSCSSSCS